MTKRGLNLNGPDLTHVLATSITSESRNDVSSNSCLAADLVSASECQVVAAAASMLAGY